MFNLQIPIGKEEENPIIVADEEEEEDTRIDLYGSSDDKVPESNIDVFPNFKPDVIDPRNLNANANLILLPTKDDIIGLLNLFPPSDEYIGLILFNAFHSPIKLKEEMYNIVKEWYTQIPQNDIQLLDQYYREYRVVKSNDWIFNLLHNIDPNVKKMIWGKYFNNTVDVSLSIDIHEPITLSIIAQNEYKKENGILVGDFLSDLKRCVAGIDMIPNIYVIKVFDTKYNSCKLKIEKESSFVKMLKSIKLGSISDGKKTIEITGLDVFNCGNNKAFIKYKGMKFTNGDYNVFNFFKGFDYAPIPVESYDFKIIQPFIMHIYAVICNSNAEIYNYLMKWVAFIFQKQNLRTCTAIVITGAQGCGKNTFTNQICKLLGFYAEENTNSKAIFDQFNSVLFYKRLLICNEKNSFEENKKLNNDLLKSYITENTLQINFKYQDQMTVENVSNFIFLSNNFAPVKIEQGDRRFVVIRASSEHALDEAYFTQLFATFNDSFYRNLLTFLLKMNISDFNPSIIPVTEEREAIQEISRSKYELFIQDFIQEFIKGFVKTEAYAKFQEWCITNGYDAGAKWQFNTEMLTYCTTHKPWNGGVNRKQIYKLKNNEYIKFKIP